MPYVPTPSGARYHYELYGDGEEKVLFVAGFACCKGYWKASVAPPPQQRTQRIQQPRRALLTPPHLLLPLLPPPLSPLPSHHPPPYLPHLPLL